MRPYEKQFLQFSKEVPPKCVFVNFALLGKSIDKKGELCYNYSVRYQKGISFAPLAQLVRATGS